MLEHLPPERRLPSSRLTARQQALADYGDLSEATFERPKGWALLFGAVLLESGLIDNPRNAVIGAHFTARGRIERAGGVSRTR